MKEELQLLIMPSFDSARESLGYEEYDDYNSDTVLFQMGYDGEIINIPDDEIFKIDTGFIGRIQSDGDFYLIKNKKDLKNKEDYLIEDDLSEGRYKYSSVDHVIYCLKKNEI